MELLSIGNYGQFLKILQHEGMVSVDELTVDKKREICEILNT